MKVFVSAVGQYDNVGDTVLRRGYLDSLRTAGPLHVYLGDKSDGYASGLGLHPGDTVYREPGAWRSRVSRELLSGDAVYAFDTGETEATAPFAKRYLRLAPLLAASRLRGGVVLHVGVGLRTRTPWCVPIAAVLRTASIVSWRDEYSRRSMGLGRVTPDWAFALGATSAELRATTDRPLLAIAIRQGLSHAARERPDDAWVAKVRALADAHGLRPVVVAQIERDSPLANDLAERLGAESVPWLDDDHARQEARLRETYRASAAVISDRLHAVVIAATEGAVPIGLTSGSHDKVQRTLETVGIADVFFARDIPDAAAAHAVFSSALARREQVVESVVDARSRLERLGFQTRELVRRAEAKL